MQQKSFGDRLSELMKPDETQQCFGKRVGINRNTIAKYINAKDCVPDTRTVIAVSRECNVTADWLLGLSDTRSANPDIQAARKLTGLSEKALKNIQNISENPILLTGLEYILTADPTRLSVLAAQVFKYLAITPHLASSSEEMDISVTLKDGHDILSLRDSAKYRRQAAAETFSEMIRIEEEN